MISDDEDIKPPTMVPCPEQPHAGCACCDGMGIVTVERRNEFMAGAVLHERVLIVSDDLNELPEPDETA